MSNNKVTQSQINKILDDAETQETIFWEKEVVVSYRLYNGFTIIGRGACVDPANFNIEIGKKVAREQAENKLWELEGYLLQNKLYKETTSNCSNECKCSSKEEPKTKEEWTALFSSYDFVDEQGHSLTMCTDFIDLVELAVR
jgi:hypothetical protein